MRLPVPHLQLPQPSRGQIPGINPVPDVPLATTAAEEFSFSARTGPSNHTPEQASESLRNFGKRQHLQASVFPWQVRKLY